MLSLSHNYTGGVMMRKISKDKFNFKSNSDISLLKMLITQTSFGISIYYNVKNC